MVLVNETVLPLGREYICIRTLSTEWSEIPIDPRYFTLVNELSSEAVIKSRIDGFWPDQYLVGSVTNWFK